MDSTQLPTINKPSGIPRASRLPVLSNKQSQASLQDAIEQPRSFNAPAKAEKRPAIPQFSKPAQPASRLSLAGGRRPAARVNEAKDSNGGPNAFVGTTATRTPYAGLTSKAKQQTIQQQASNIAASEDQENHDTLRAVGSFRAGSRQGFHDALPTDQHDMEHASDVATSPRKAKPSRPSLSERTMESIQKVPSTPKERRGSSFFSPVDSPMGPPPLPTSVFGRDESNEGGRPGSSGGTFAKRLGTPSVAENKVISSAKPSSKSYRSSLCSVTRSSVASTPTAAGVKNGIQRNPSAMTASKIVGAKSTKPRPPLTDAFGPDVTIVSSPHASKASSAAFRQQIAAAKAAARKEKNKQSGLQSRSTAATDPDGSDLQTDPFNQSPKDSKHILRNRIHAARMTGKLNVAALKLTDIPDEVLTMYGATAMAESKVNWAEVVDLTRLIAADNDIEELSEACFPDKSVDDFENDDEGEGNQFGGLEVLDLHRNRLKAMPTGLRRLERLTTINLSHNRLENDVLDVMSQIPSVKELRLGHNALSGVLPSSITKIVHLETLDLQSNRLLGLPEALRELVGLRVLNVSSNQLTTIPFEALQELPLTEVDASNNALIASLFLVDAASGHPTLQTLRVANNSLATLTFDETLELPRLRTLDVTNNHLTRLPSISAWTELITITAGDNKIAELPPGFTSLHKLKNANFGCNELRLLDYEIANMESLESLILVSNPLRDKKFLTMSTSDIKRDLKARLASAEVEETGSSTNNVQSSWSLTGNRELDLAGKAYNDSINDKLESFLRANDVNRLSLQSNILTNLPSAFSLARALRTLDLSRNDLSSEYLPNAIDLLLLQELKLSRCNLHSLGPLMTQLRSPSLKTLDVTANRLSGALPDLHVTYPALITLLAGDNRFKSITAESLHGLQTVNLSSNNIEQLPAEVGLLWHEGLRHLEIGANAFRVPNHRVLEKGTEATMQWLRDRLPASHGMVVENGGAEEVLN